MRKANARADGEAQPHAEDQRGEKGDGHDRTFDPIVCQDLPDVAHLDQAEDRADDERRKRGTW